MAEVSVLMTVYNGMPYLPAAVQSILDQTLQDFHFVIVNDGSTDETADYLDGLNDDRISVIHQENTGTAGAANHGLSHVKTPLLARMDADDVAISNRLEIQLKFLNENPEVGLVGGQVIPMGAHGEGGSLLLPLHHEEIDRSLMLGQHGLAHSSLMMRTPLLNSIGGYWKHRLVDDIDMMIRMGEITKLANVDDVLLKYRVHAGSVVINTPSNWQSSAAPVNHRLLLKSSKRCNATGHGSHAWAKKCMSMPSPSIAPESQKFMGNVACRGRFESRGRCVVLPVEPCIESDGSRKSRSVL